MLILFSAIIAILGVLVDVRCNEGKSAGIIVSLYGISLALSYLALTLGG